MGGFLGLIDRGCEERGKHEMANDYATTWII